MRRAPIPLLDKLVLTSLLDGHLVVALAGDKYVSRWLLEKGCWEAATNVAIDLIVRPGMHVLEIGCHLGSHSVRIAKRIGPEGRLRCFEANPEVAEIARANLIINGYHERATVACEACFSHRVECELFIPLGNLASASLSAAVLEKQNSAWSRGVRRLPVTTVMLDEVLGVERVDVIKIDAEGAEYAVLQGAQKLLEASKPDMIMEWLMVLDEHESRELYRYLSSFGYHIHHFDNGGIYDALESEEQLLRTLSELHAQGELAQDFLITTTELSADFAGQFNAELAKYPGECRERCR